MMPAKGFLLLFLMFLFIAPAPAQVIHGEVLDIDSKKAISAVDIENVHTSMHTETDGKGGFVIAAVSDQLLVFRKEGYRTVRVRIPKGYIPSYFRIILNKGFSDLPADIARKNRYDNARDSIRSYELYKHELEFPRMTTFEMIQSPFTALSHHNREIWRFQDDYEYFEQERYIDRTFNRELITKLTGLKDDSLTAYMRRYRPAYQQLRSMNDYTFFNFIKSSVYYFRNTSTPRNPQ